MSGKEGELFELSEESRKQIRSSKLFQDYQSYIHKLIVDDGVDSTIKPIKDLRGQLSLPHGMDISK